MHRLPPQFRTLATGPLDGSADRVAELGREPVARHLGAVFAVHVVDFYGDVGFQRRKPHQRVDQRRHARIGAADAADQHFQRRAIARADHRQQRHRRHALVIGGGDRTLDRFDPSLGGGVQEAVAQEYHAHVDHLGGIGWCPIALLGEAAHPLMPIGGGNGLDLGLQNVPAFATRLEQRALEVEHAEPRRGVDPRTHRAGCCHCLGRYRIRHAHIPGFWPRFGPHRTCYVATVVKSRLGGCVAMPLRTILRPPPG